MDLATQRMWRWLDQDVLNRVADGEYVRIHMKWNYLMDWQHLRRTHIVKNAAPDVRQEYEEARQDPKIVHFAGPDNRPWLYPDADGAGLFCATQCTPPTWRRFAPSLRSRATPWRAWPSVCRSSCSTKGIMPAFDKTCPGGTKRRSAIIRIYDKLGGTRL